MRLSSRTRKNYGFSSASSLLNGQIRRVAETRGFAATDILTRWDAIVGADIAKNCEPADIRFGRNGLGATLTIETTGAYAPIIEMQKPQIIERINVCYGYRAISGLRITQSARKGGNVQKRLAKKTLPVLPKPAEKARDLAKHVENTELRLALEQMAANVMTTSKTEKPQK